MTLSKITTKGQVTIPKKIREQLHLNAGDQIDFIINDDGDLIIKPIANQLDSIIGIIKTNKKATVEEMSAAISKRMKTIK